ncbi:MAG: hypothetical protein II830_02270 [Alphaproteobacteria bacterium]|nr:hypothetical protein [Alphaproteobacteria bacterium]
MAKVKKPNKQELKEVKEQMKERFAAFRRGARDEEIEDHNGKPFTHPQVTKDKTKYNRKTMKKVSRDDY